MKVIIKGFVYQRSYGGEKDHVVFTSDKMGDEYFVLVGPAEFDYELPDNFDPRPAMVKAMREQIEELQSDTVMKVTRLQGKINELLAIESKPVDPNKWAFDNQLESA